MTTGIAAGIVAGIALGIVTGIAGAVCTNGCGAAERVVARSPLVERSTDERGAVEPTVAPGMGNRRIAPDTSAAWDTSAGQDT